MSKSSSFEDTVRNLLRMKPKPHKESADKERRPGEQDGAKSSEANSDKGQS